MRYAGKLLFQYIAPHESPDSLLVIEERTLVLKAASAGKALKAFRARGTEGAFSFVNNYGVKMKFQFVGVLEMISLGIESDDDEVWYVIRKMKGPRNRVPASSELLAVKNEKRAKERKRK